MIDEDDGLGDEPPKAELTEEEARCSMRKNRCGACSKVLGPEG